jgi:hypothetical protein
MRRMMRSGSEPQLSQADVYLMMQALDGDGGTTLSLQEAKRFFYLAWRQRYDDMGREVESLEEDIAVLLERGGGGGGGGGSFNAWGAAADEGGSGGSGAPVTVVELEGRLGDLRRSRSALRGVLSRDFDRGYRDAVRAEEQVLLLCHSFFTRSRPNLPTCL